MTTKTKSAPAVRNEQPQNGDGKLRPVHEVRLGRICGAVWQHESGDGKPWFNVTLSRIYRDENDKWARSDSFGKYDLPLVIKVANLCHDWLYFHAQDEQN